MRARKEESFNGITERKSRESRALNKGRKCARMQYAFFFTERSDGWIDGWMDGRTDRLTTRYDVVYCVQKSEASKTRGNDETAKIHKNNHNVF